MSGALNVARAAAIGAGARGGRLCQSDQPNRPIQASASSTSRPASRRTPPGVRAESGTCGAGTVSHTGSSTAGPSQLSG